jgi:hypothetical protein
MTDELHAELIRRVLRVADLDSETPTAEMSLKDFHDVIPTDTQDPIGWITNALRSLTIIEIDPWDQPDDRPWKVVMEVQADRNPEGVDLYVSLNSWPWRVRTLRSFQKISRP